MSSPIVSAPDPHAPRRLSPNVAALGYVSMLTAMSSAIIYSLLPIFMVSILGISIASVGSARPPDTVKGMSPNAPVSVASAEALLRPNGTRRFMAASSPRTGEANT